MIKTKHTAVCDGCGLEVESHSALPPREWTRAGKGLQFRGWDFCPDCWAKAEDAIWIVEVPDDGDDSCAGHS
jgi:hypothetical protein